MTHSPVIEHKYIDRIAKPDGYIRITYNSSAIMVILDWIEFGANLTNPN